MKNNKKINWKSLCLVFLAAILLAGGPLMASGPAKVSAAKKTTGIYTIKNEKYYYIKGKRQTGWHQIKGKWYYFKKSEKGAMVTGFQKIKGERYAFAKSGRAFKKGWHQVGKSWYYTLNKGRVKTGWHFEGPDKEKKYYLKKSGKNMGAAAVGTYIMGDGKGKKFENTFNKRGLLIKSVEVKPQEPDKPQETGKPEKPEKPQETGKPEKPEKPQETGKPEKPEEPDKPEKPEDPQEPGKPSGLQAPTEEATIRNYLLHSLRAMGTPYKQIAGWPGTASTSIPSTMDCSGFVGWATYQMTQRPGGCALKSYDIPATYAAWGYGETRSHEVLAENNFKGQFKAGDVVKVKHDGGTGHVWIVLGQCSDGSYVLVHSSPPCVQISGTPTPEGAVGEAFHLALEYMKKYHQPVLDQYNMEAGKGAYGPYGTQGTDLYNYITSEQVSSFRFADSILSDPEGYKNMDAGQILQDLYGES